MKVEINKKTYILGGVIYMLCNDEIRQGEITRIEIEKRGISIAFNLFYNVNGKWYSRGNFSISEKSLGSYVYLSKREAIKGAKKFNKDIAKIQLICKK